MTESGRPVRRRGQRRPARPVRGRPTLHRPDMAGVDGSPRKDEHVGRPQLGEQQLVQPLPDSGLVPIPKPSPARHPRAEAQFLGQKPPRDTCVDDKQNSAEHLPTIQAPSARVTVPALDHQHQRLDPCPQSVVDLPRLAHSLRLD